MWKDYEDRPDTYGHHGKEYQLRLSFQTHYYGHEYPYTSKVVTAIWDSINECFYEKDTGLEINEEDIAQWWDEKAKSLDRDGFAAAKLR